MNGELGLIQKYFGLLPETGEERVLQLLMDLAMGVIDGQSGAILALDESQQALVFVVATGTTEEQAALLGQKVPLGKGLTGLAAMTHEVQMGAPTYKGVRQAEVRGGASGTPTALIAAPMLIGEKLIGVVTAADFRPQRSFRDSDAGLLSGFASIAAVVIDMYQRLRKERCTNDDSPLSLGVTAVAEKEVAEAIRRIAGRGPAAMVHLSHMLASIEKLVSSEGVNAP